MDLQDEITKVAYELFVKSGFIPDRDMENWLEAERIVMEKYKAENPAEAALEIISKPKKAAAKAKKEPKKTETKTAKKKAEPKKTK